MRIEEVPFWELIVRKSFCLIDTSIYILRCQAIKYPAQTSDCFAIEQEKYCLPFDYQQRLARKQRTFTGPPPPVMSQIPDDHCAEDHIKAHSHTQPHTHH